MLDIAKAFVMIVASLIALLAPAKLAAESETAIYDIKRLQCGGQLMEIRIDRVDDNARLSRIRQVSATVYSGVDPNEDEIVQRADLTSEVLSRSRFGYFAPHHTCEGDLISIGIFTVTDDYLIAIQYDGDSFSVIY